VGVMPGLSLGTCMSNLKSVALIVLELLAFNAQKIRGHVTVATPPCWENFWRSCPDCPWEHVSNLKSVALTVLELLAFNAQKFRGSRDRGHAAFWIKFLGITSGPSLGTRLSNLKSVALTVLELLAFNSHDRPQRTHTHRQTHIERTHYLLRSLRGDNQDLQITVLVVVVHIMQGKVVLR